MATRIEVRGVIVPSIYDGEWFADYIDRGIITPESRVRAAASAADGEIDLYINSPGGSVFSACEMANAILAAREGGNTVRVTVGAVAASAASALALMVADKVRLHSNSKLMFHGATVETWGGAGAHDDAAELLGKINADIMASLTGRYSLDPDVVAEWFAEGREGWLTAQEAQAAGMVSEIIGAAAMPPAIAPDDIAALGEHGLAIAAIADRIETEDPDDGRDAGDTAGADDTEAEAGDGVDAGGGPDAGAAGGDTDPGREAYDAGYDAGSREAAARARTEALAEMAEQLQAAHTAHNEDAETIAALSAELDEARGECDRLADELANAQNRIAGLTRGFAAPDNTDTGSEFWDIVRQYMDDGLTKDKAIAKARRTHREAFRSIKTETPA